MSEMTRRKFLKFFGVAAGGAVLMPKDALGQMGGPPGQYQPAHVSITDPAQFIHPTLASSSREEVGVRLVSMFDVSGSIDKAEYEVQIDAMADTIASDDFRDAIFFQGGPQSIAICFADFGTYSDLRIPWVDIRKGDEAKIKLLAEEVRNLKTKRRESGSTHQVTALNYSDLCLTNCPWQAKRSVVDLLTDGQNNGGGGEVELRLARDLLAENGATVNALVTVSDNANGDGLEAWARTNLATPPGSKRADGTPLDAGFVKVVAYESTEESRSAIVEYNQAMELAFRRKLILEVAGVELEELRQYSTGNGFPVPAGNVTPLLRP